jgi:5-methylcytosine-specific restriction protein B
MHGREDNEGRSLMYWLEFKNDDQFAGTQFGSIAGGSALKFGIYQRQSDASWMTGSPSNQKVIDVAQAVEIARRQRNELVAGADVLDKMPLDDTSDGTYAALQRDLERAAPDLVDSVWAHKYWFLNHPQRLDPYHQAGLQRFHLFKMLQMPPDKIGIWKARERYVCAGRYVAIAKELETTTQALATVLNQRNPFHHYWRIASARADGYWPVMLEGGYVAVASEPWSGDLTQLPVDQKEARAILQAALLPRGEKLASIRANELLNFARKIAEKDLVVACDGDTVVGIGRVTGDYEYDSSLATPHKLPVDWLSTETWPLPEPEGSKRLVYELGSDARNLLETETRVVEGKKTASPQGPAPKSSPDPSAAGLQPTSLRPLDPMHGRIDGILRRKGQVILYGPPGTGKTYHALAAARELAARQAFRCSYPDLSDAEKHRIDGGAGYVRVCTFHPGYGYEDFMEGYRPRIAGDNLVFAASDGIFKRLCQSAAADPGNPYFLVIDEINRGDLARIFGELITALELNKRDLRLILPVSGTPFTVPSNVFLIGTMNTADRSISILDAALRRRFGFIELMPDGSRLAGYKVGPLALDAWLDALNARLRKYLKRDARNLQIGHAYLMPRNPIKSTAEFSRILREDIVPLLEEYCYDDFGMLRDILGKELVDAEQGRIREEMFTPAREDSLITALSTYEELQSGQEAAPEVSTEDQPNDADERSADDDAASA